MAGRKLSNNDHGEVSRIAGVVEWIIRLTEVSKGQIDIAAFFRIADCDGDINDLSHFDKELVDDQLFAYQLNVEDLFFGQKLPVSERLDA